MGVLHLGHGRDSDAAAAADAVAAAADLAAADLAAAAAAAVAVAAAAVVAAAAPLSSVLLYMEYFECSRGKKQQFKPHLWLWKPLHGVRALALKGLRLQRDAVHGQATALGVRFLSTKDL